MDFLSLRWLITIIFEMEAIKISLILRISFPFAFTFYLLFRSHAQNHVAILFNILTGSQFWPSFNTLCSNYLVYKCIPMLRRYIKEWKLEGD